MNEHELANLRLLALAVKNDSTLDDIRYVMPFSSASSRIIADKIDALIAAVLLPRIMRPAPYEVDDEVPTLQH